MRAVQLFLSLDELFFLVGEVDVLIERFLVDVTVLLQLLIALIQLLEELKHTRSTVWIR